MKKLELVMEPEQTKLLETMIQVFQDCLYELPQTEKLLWEVTKLRFILRSAVRKSKEV